MNWGFVKGSRVFFWLYQYEISRMVFLSECTKMPMRNYHARGLSMKSGIAFSLLLSIALCFDANAAGLMKCPEGSKLTATEIGSNFWNRQTVYTCREINREIKKAAATCDTQGTKSCATSDVDKKKYKDLAIESKAMMDAQAKRLADAAKKNTAGSYRKPRVTKSSSTSAKSEPKPEPVTNPIVAAPTVVAQPAGGTPLEVCIKNYDQQVSSCVNDAEQANTKCDEKLSEDQEMASARKMAGDISSGATKSAIGARAGSGAADQCAQIAMLGNTATLAMNAFKENCDEIYSGCIESCKTVREVLDNGSAYEACKRDLSSAPAEIDGLPADDYLTKQIDRMKNTFNEGDSVCTEAGKKHNFADQLMRSLGESTRAAKTCQCQLSASNQTGAGSFDASVCAQSIPSPADCLPGASLAGSPACNVYANDDCTLGSGKFNSIPCQCARDNSASVCRSVAGKPAPSNFAMDLKSVADGGGAGGGGADGGDGGGNLNLSGGYNLNKTLSDQKPTDASAAGNGYAGGGGGGGASGGGGGSGGDSGEDPGALGEDDGSGKGGLAGLFNQVKSSVGDMFGSKNKSGKTAGSRGGNAGRTAGYNIKDWIPRGVAGTGCQASQLRCKNEDIFSIMNQRYDNNEMTFIQSP